MRIGIKICFALVILATGVFLPPTTYADGGRGNWHGHYNGHNYGHNYGHYYGHYYDDSLLLGLGLGLVFSPFVFGYPYYAPAPIYAPPAQLPPTSNNPDQRSYNTVQKESAYCREYTKEILVDGKAVTAHGTACLQGDGSWRIMN